MLELPWNRRALLLSLLLAVREQDCWNDFSPLAELMPRYGLRPIDDVRQQIVSSSVVSMMRDVRSRRVAPNVAISLALKQAEVNDRSLDSALAVVSQVGGGSPSAIRRQLGSGTRISTECESIGGGARCLAVVLHFSAIANRAMAAEFACHLQAGTFPPASLRIPLE